MKIFASIGASILFLSSALASSSYDRDIQKFLREFHQNTAEAMDWLPQSIDAKGKAHFRGKIDYEKLKSSGVFKERDRVRKKIMDARDPELDALPEASDKPEILVENGQVLRDIYRLAQSPVASLAQQPWSDSYWPIYKGLIATRYSDPDFPNSKVWLNNYEYIQTHPASSIVALASPAEIEMLSPAEKYDLLVGDSNWSLTQYSWNEGLKRQEEVGAVATWEGICHGWSAAAHMNAPVATRSVDALSPTGIRVRFYPGDLRALTSLLWADGPPATRFVGNRCKVENPEKDKNGRILDQGCFDTNPSTFHLALINQLGINQRSFVMDATYDAQVWNFAISSYSMTYFNPQDLRPRSNVAQAIIPIEQFKVDKFKKYRSEDTRYIVGVTLDVTYSNATVATRNTHSNSFKTERYFYDLELNAQHEVIGGEWYTNAHPDFIWTFAAGSKAKALADMMIEPGTHWDPRSVMPESWMNLARASSARGQPMSAILDILVETGK